MNIGPAHTRKPPYKQSGEQCRQENTQSGQYDTGGKDGFDFSKLSVHTARKQYDTQGYHTDELRFFCIMELQSQSVTAEEHTHYQKEQ